MERHDSWRKAIFTSFVRFIIPKKNKVYITISLQEQGKPEGLCLFANVLSVSHYEKLGIK